MRIRRQIGVGPFHGRVHIGVRRGRNHQGLQRCLAVAAHHRLNNFGLSDQMAFNPFWRDIPAETGDDQVGLPPLDPQPTILVDMSNVPGRERPRGAGLANEPEKKRSIDDDFAVIRDREAMRSDRGADAAD